MKSLQILNSLLQHSITTENSEMIFWKKIFIANRGFHHSCKYLAVVPAIHFKSGTKPTAQNLHRAFRFYPAAIQQYNFNQQLKRVLE
jgi:hypothetical protein